MSPKAVHFYILVNYHVQNTKIEDAAHIMAASPKKNMTYSFFNLFFCHVPGKNTPKK